jgi:general secretion pathway protein D
VEDGGIIVLGGLMQDTVTESEDRVPGLGSIPLIGNLFKSRSGSRQKTNLLVFLRPTILRDQSATEAISASKYNEIRDEQKSLNGGKITLLPGEKQPSIPAIPPGHTPPPSIRAPAGPQTDPAPVHTPEP